MSKEDVLKQHSATPDQWPSLRETWPPETVAMTVEEVTPAAGEGDFSAPQASPPEPVLGPPRELPPRRDNTPEETLRQAELAVDTTRHELRVARDTLASARTNVATALANYNRAMPTISAEQNTRNWIAANNAERARRAEAGRNFVPTVTETARAMGGGGHGNDIRTKRGGGDAYRRGPGGVQAYTKHQAQTANANRIIAERAAAKLPSER